MILDIEHSQKIITPEIPGYYYSRERLIEKILSYESKKLILITAPAGYGKTSFSVEYFHRLNKGLRMWISLSPYDNSIENFFLLFALAFENNFRQGDFSSRLKSVLAKSQNISIKDKINNVISTFSSDLHVFLKKQGKDLYIFLDDFHNIDESDEICTALNYFLEYLPVKVKFIFISRRDPRKINYPKFLAKGWLGRITQSDLCFNETDIENFIKQFQKKTDKIDKNLFEEFLKTTEGWVTALQILLMTNDYSLLKSEDIHQSRNDIFEYFTNEVYKNCSEEQKTLLLILSYLESFNKYIIENVLGIVNGYHTLIELYESNVFISREDDNFRFHELLKRYLNKIASDKFTKSEVRAIYQRIGKYYLRNKEWREDYIALNYLILGEDFESLNQWIRLNASDKLLLIHSSGLFKKFEEIKDSKFRNSLEYILLKVNTFIYKEKNTDKALDFLENALRHKFSIAMNKNILIPVSKIKKDDMNYYVELLMLICNCNSLKEGISAKNIRISEHILKFDLKTEQEIQFIVSLVKSYITTGENSKSRKYIERLKDIFNNIASNRKKGIKTVDENSLVESVFSMLIFFDYGDYKMGNNVIKFIKNNFDFRNFDLSNYSQVCFALFASYNLKEFEVFYEFLKAKNSEKSRTIFSAYKNQFEFQTILKNFLGFEFKSVVRELEQIKKGTHLKNYIFFIDSLILYCMNLLGQPFKMKQLLSENGFNVSKTRLLILQLESSLLLNDYKEYARILSEIKKVKRENFTLFNQAVITFCECYYCALKDDAGKFSGKFRQFLNMCIEFDYYHYIVFRAKAGMLSYVFEYALKTGIDSVYLKNVFITEGIKIIPAKKRQVKIDAQYLNGSRIVVNGIEFPDSCWSRSKSKPVFLYMLYQTYFGNDITKESLIDDVLYTSKSVNYDAIADVEVNKVRKSFQNFLSEIFGEKLEKEVLILKERKYYLTSKNIELEIKIDVDEFRMLAASSSIEDKIKAVEIYKTDFAKESYNSWAEDIRENLKFIYSDTIHKILPHFEKKGKSQEVVRLLEKLVDIDYNDEDVMMKLLSAYNSEKNFRKFKFAYKSYEKRLKSEYNAHPSQKLKKFFSDVTLNS